jgi:anthranilate synthase component II
MEKILVFDNYDSFTYNLVHLIEKVSDNVKVHVVRNDEFSLEKGANYDRIIISPGPGIPEEAGNLLAFIKMYKGKKPMLGVCLGQQAICVAEGGKLINLDKVYHGVSTPMQITENDSVLFRDVKNGFNAGRYHSWVIDEQTLPPNYCITVRDEQNQVMAIEDRDQRIYAVQFHPESIMTDCGEQIMLNFLNS